MQELHQLWTEGDEFTLIDLIEREPARRQALLIGEFYS